MTNIQPAIVADNPSHARFLTFNIQSTEGLKHCLQELQGLVDGDNLVIGLGPSLIKALEASLDGLRSFPAITMPGLDIPSTQAALWCWLRGKDRGELFHQTRLIEALLVPTFTMTECVDAYQYDCNRDLSGYEDGTENPQGDDAIEAAIVQNQGPGLDGSSFVAVQQWLHDFDVLDSMSTEQQDDCIGRHIEDNEEFDAPISAHVKRSAQEDFEPEAFMLRHSMPWSADIQGGLMFIAFGHSFDAFEAVLRRMAGEDDGVVDGLFQFSHPITGSYYWCPPMSDGKLDLSRLGL